MPKLGETMEEGYLLKWLKREGEGIKSGEPLFEVMSDKTNFEVEASEDGFLRKILIQPGEMPIPVTKVIGYLADNMQEKLPESKEEKKERVPISPLAKRLAKEKGIDLTEIKGSGLGGRIEKNDILKITKGSEEKEFEIKPLTAVRKTIAQRMSASKRTIPHYYLTIEIEMDRTAELKKKKDFSYTDFIIKAVGKALAGFPLMNAAIIDEEIRIYRKINVGLAVLSRKGLLVPVINDAEKKSLIQISQERGSLREKADNDRLSPEDLRGGTFTISNLGTFGVDNFTAIINPPEVGILALGKIKEVPVAAEGRLVVKKIMKATLSADHRLIDGAYGAQFLKRIKELLQNPQCLEE